MPATSCVTPAASSTSTVVPVMLNSIDVEIESALWKLTIEQAWEEYDQIEDIESQIDELCEMLKKF